MDELHLDRVEQSHTHSQLLTVLRLSLSSKQINITWTISEHLEEATYSLHILKSGVPLTTQLCTSEVNYVT